MLCADGRGHRARCPPAQLPRRPAPSVVEAGGGLVTEPFVDAHLHLDKVRTLPLIGDAALQAYTADGMADSARGIDLARAVKQHYRRRDAPAAHPAGAGRRAAQRRPARAGVRRRRHRRRAGRRPGGAGRPGGVPGAGRRLGRRLPAGRRAARPGRRRRWSRRRWRPGADVVGGIPWIEADDGRPGGARRVGVRARRPAGPAGRDAHRRRPGPRLRHHPHARRGDAPARARGPRAWPATPGPSGTTTPTARTRCSTWPGTSGSGLVSDPHTGSVALPVERALARGRGRRARPGRHRGRLLPVRPAQPARGRLPRRAPAGHAVGAAAGGAGRPGDDVGRPGARAWPTTASAEGGPADLLVHDATRTVDLLARHAPPRVVIRAGRVLT